MEQPKTILERIWGQGLDSSVSVDFRDADGQIDEQKYLRYKKHAVNNAEQALAEWVQSKKPHVYTDDELIDAEMDSHNRAILDFEQALLEDLEDSDSDSKSV